MVKQKTKVAAVISKTTKATVTPAAKKVATKKTSAAAAEPKMTKPPAVKKVSAPVAKIKAPANKVTAKLSPEERYRMVETAAYFIAEQHGFQGRSDEHWAAAERAIAAKLGQ